MTILSNSRLIASALILLGGVSLAGCDDKNEFEQLGEKADEAVNDASRAVDDATD
jgi:hypothetical protein